MVAGNTLGAWAHYSLVKSPTCLKTYSANCAACGFNFQDFYGDFAAGFIEIHHLLPLHMEENNRRETNYMTDLIPLCSNCHSVVHRKQDSVISLEELVKMIKMQQ